LVLPNPCETGFFLQEAANFPPVHPVECYNSLSIGTNSNKGDNLMSDKIVHVTDSSFQSDVLEADKPVLVDYWAEWCGPCKMIAPILTELADEYADKLKICKMDIDANQETPPRFGIRGIPTLMLFKNGELEATKVGALSKSQLAAFLDSNI